MLKDDSEYKYKLNGLINMFLVFAEDEVNARYIWQCKIRLVQQMIC